MVAGMARTLATSSEVDLEPLTSSARRAADADMYGSYWQAWSMGASEPASAEAPAATSVVWVYCAGCRWLTSFTFWLGSGAVGRLGW